MCAGQINQSCPFRSITPGAGPSGTAPLVPRPDKCLGAGKCAQFRSGPVAYSRFEERENRRDPAPILADVYQRENERSFPLPQLQPPTAPASPPPRATAPGASIAANVVAALNRLYNAAKLGDVTGSPTPAAAPAPAPQHSATVLLSKSARGAVLDILV